MASSVFDAMTGGKHLHLKIDNKESVLEQLYQRNAISKQTRLLQYSPNLNGEYIVLILVAVVVPFINNIPYFSELHCKPGIISEMQQLYCRWS